MNTDSMDGYRIKQPNSLVPGDVVRWQTMDADTNIVTQHLTVASTRWTPGRRWAVYFEGEAKPLYLRPQQEVDVLVALGPNEYQRAEDVTGRTHLVDPESGGDGRSYTLCASVTVAWWPIEGSTFHDWTPRAQLTCPGCHREFLRRLRGGGRE